MYKNFCLFLIGGLMLAACNTQTPNPFFTEWNTPFQTPPFEVIKPAHYLPAFTEGIRLETEEINAIAANSEAPTFENTIVAMEKAGALLTKVSKVFNNMTEALTNDEMQAVAKEVAPLLSKQNDDILMNEKLFSRIISIYDQKENLNLTGEQIHLLEKYYKDFVRGGANLDAVQKQALREINTELSVLSVNFSENVLKENNRFELVIENKDDLAGLPEASIAAAAETAKERGNEGKWVFTLHKPSLIPFLQYSEKRDLREKMFKGYINRGDNNNDLDNKSNVSKIVSLRVKKANLLGYESHADYELEENMSKNPETVYNLLDQLWTPALAMAKKEVRDMQTIIDKEENKFTLAAWDWWHYAEKVKKAKYDLDEEELRPYFKLENVRAGAFGVANKLWGITLTERTDISLYHPDVKVFEVKEADGTHIGILYTDYFPRASKRGGAWMDEFRGQSKLYGENITPLITNVGNFSKPSGDKPALLSLDETLTLFHEFGHALHGLLSDNTYPSISGTNVSRDFVELCSQIMENWALEPEVLRSYARHYKTGEPIPEALIEKIDRSGKFNQGFATVEYLAASYLDMDWHTVKDSNELAVQPFEDASMNRLGLIPEIVSRYRSTYFNHIFSNDYSAGYYSYIWAEVLDADAFQAFKETSLFDRKTAESYRRNILARGASDEPMNLYKAFRGREPKIEPLLIKRGLK
ncbi:MAG: M3 family peptidase [Calditrichales bacterium]|nr:MAG: M3 family peptidase [Calditrichales bacterium]